MMTVDEHRQKLISELIEQSAKIDLLVVKSRQISVHHGAFDDSRTLEALRARQRDTTEKLHALEIPGSNVWENIGEGG